jgi:hypothetical protein
MASWNRIDADVRQRIIAHAVAGKQPALIAREADVTVDISTIYQVLAQARKGGIAIRRFSPRPLRKPDGVVVRFHLASAAQQATLDVAARARGVSRSVLVARLVSAALDDRMIDAILDDGVASDAG